MADSALAHVTHGSPSPAGDDGACRNCGAPLSGPYCSACGQRSRDLHVSFSTLVHEFLHDYLHLDGKLARTLWLLFRRPGFLTGEYMRGRRARYAGPFQLYLVTSMLFFVVWAVVPASGHFVVLGTDRSPRHVAVAPPGGGGAEPLGDSEAFAPFDLSAAKKERLSALGPDGIRQHLLQTFSADAPKAVLLLLPLVALLVKAVARRRYYVEHLVFALHLHAAAFLTLSAGMLARIGGVATIAVLAHGLVAARAHYGWSWLRAGAAALFVSVGYVVALVVAIVGLVGIALLTA